MNENVIKLYFNKKQLIIFFMGISSGIPLYLILSTLFIWLAREDIDISTIGLFALTQIPWSLKFFWAPFIDNYKIPFLNNFLGQRKSWLLFTQINLSIFIICLGYSNPKDNLEITAIFALLVAFFSATQDIVVDAYRIEILNDNSQGAGAAMTQFGYRIGGLVAGAGSLYLTSYFSWEQIFFVVSLIILFLMILVIFVIPSKNSHVASKKNLITPFKEFIFRNTFTKIFLIFLFIFFFKFGDVIAGVMANPFYVKIGFTNVEIANASKVFGVIMTIIGVFTGGYLVKEVGILKALLISGIFQIVSNLLYVLLNSVGPEINYLFLTVAGENLSGGLGSAAFVAYLSALCNKKYTGTQYALLSSIMGLARAILSSPSGYFVEAFGWSNFFIFSTFCGLPSILILFWMWKNFPIDYQKSKP